MIQTMERELSISEYFYERGGPGGHRCGYCGSKDTNISNGMWTHQVTCQDYQDLIERGWRRSGKYCYKPVMSKTCCPMYAIRCEATNFRLSKSQKGVAKKMKDFLLHGKKEKSQDESSHHSDAQVSQTLDAQAKSAKVVRPGVGPDPAKPPSRKAKLIRKERKLQKCAAKMEEENTEEKPDSEKSTLASTKKGEEKQPTSTGGSAAAKSPGLTPDFLKVGPDGRKPLEMFLSIPDSDKPPAHRLEVKLVRSSPPSAEFKDTLKQSYGVYKKYQMAVHHDKESECSQDQYERFLCDSPLIPHKGASGWPCDYGSYHQQYYIDGKLVMVGVIDILPNYLSSVYLYYDPDYGFLNLGVYSALNELTMVRQLYTNNSAFKYYCMGYYVHSCQKMRYKGQYSPSFLLCPESYCFIPIERCRPKLDANRYARLNDEPTEQERVETWFNNSIILFQRTLMPYAVFKGICGPGQDPQVKEYAGFVGPKVSSRMALFLSGRAD